MDSLRIHDAVDAGMQVGNTGRRIEGYSRGSQFSLEELDSFQVQLLEAERLLLTGAYRSEGIRIARVPDRTEELFGDVGFYWSAGQVWKALLLALGANRPGQVAEVGCGVVPKVAGALHYLDFKGSVDLVDVSEASLNRASRWLTLLGSRFTHKPVRAPLFRLSCGAYDGLFANHIIDDLLLHEYCLISGRSLDDLYLNGKLYGDMWREIAGNRSWIVPFVEKLSATIAAALAPGGMVVLCDYQSHSHRELGLLEISSIVIDARERLRREFVARGMRSLESRVPLYLRSDRFQIDQSDVIAFQRGDAAP